MEGAYLGQIRMMIPHKAQTVEIGWPTHPLLQNGWARGDDGWSYDWRSEETKGAGGGEGMVVDLP